METRQTMLALGLMLLAIGFAVSVTAATVPSAPETLIVGPASTLDPANYKLQSTIAYAGNITRLDLTGVSQTKSWQGYYGNITGTITLDDASNFTFYNWSSAHPRGQVYATLNTTISWLDVQCFGFDNESINISTIDAFYNIQLNDPDGVNQTYNQTTHPTFSVAYRNMTGCPTTYIFQSDLYQQANFVNVLLWDTTNNATGWIYTTMIEDKTPNSVSDFQCYNGDTCDFQLLVNEDGHSTDVNPTTYYFWVELI